MHLCHCWSMHCQQAVQGTRPGSRPCAPRARCRLQTPAAVFGARAPQYATNSAAAVAYASAGSSKALRSRWQLSPPPAAAAALDGSPDDDAVPQWRGLVGMAAGCLLLCNLHRSTFAVLLPELASQLQLRPTQTGLLQSTMLATYLLGQLPAGRAADKQGGLRVLITSLCLWSAATALAAAAASLTASPLAALGVLLVSRLCMGWSSACIMPCSTSILVTWVPPEQRASSLSFIYANFNVGGVLGLSLVPLLSAAAGISSAFLLSGAAGLVWAGACVAACLQLLTSTNQGGSGGSISKSGSKRAGGTKATHARSEQSTEAASGATLAAAAGAGVSSSSSSLSSSTPAASSAVAGSSAPAAESQQLGSAAVSSTSSRSQRSWGNRLGRTLQVLGRQLLGHRPSAADWQQVLLLCGTHAVMGWGFFMLQNWLPLYLASLGPQQLVDTGRLSSMPWLAAALAGMLVGSAADGLIQWGIPVLEVRRLMQCISFWGCGAAVLPLIITPQPGVGLATACLTANLAAYSFSYGGFHAYLQDVAGKRAGVLQGLTNSCSILTGIAGTVMTGWLLEVTGSYSGVFVLLIGIYAVAGLAWAVCVTPHKLA